jgi:hypothetical protein
MIKFIKTYELDDSFREAERFDIEMTTDDEASVDDLATLFERFLYACGYHTDNQVDVYLKGEQNGNHI